MGTLEPRGEIEELYYDYAEALDECELDRWPEFFVEDCWYKIVSRENHERGLPLATMWCESKGMLRDRVITIQQTQMFAPRVMRHLVSNIRIKSHGSEGLRSERCYGKAWPVPAVRSTFEPGVPMSDVLWITEAASNPDCECPRVERKGANHERAQGEVR